MHGVGSTTTSFFSFCLDNNQFTRQGKQLAPKVVTMEGASAAGSDVHTAVRDERQSLLLEAGELQARLAAAAVGRAGGGVLLSASRRMGLVAAACA